MTCCLSASQAAPTHISRFQGNSTYQAATYHSVQLGQAWPGVAVELTAHGNNVEKLFHVAPGADAGQIQVQLQGAKTLRLGEQGQLIAQTGHGDVAYTAPVAYQTINQQRIDVPVRYVLGKGKQHSYQFALGEYDRSAPLVIDPLIQSTYLGGNNYDQANALVVADGDVLVAGWTSSTNFPGTNGGAQAAHAADGGGRDAFVSRLSGDLKTLRQSTYLGGSGDDYAYPLAVDSTTGDVLVAGYTTSTDFPGASSGAQTASGGGSYDVFVSRLSGDLKTLVQSTYLGGSNDEFAAALAVASNGDVLVAGYARSTDFPGTSDGAQAAHAADGGGYDGFVSRLSGDLKTLRQSTYLGGSSDDYVYALAVDSTTGDALVAGYTYSSDFPNTSGGAQTASGGGYDGFVSRLSGDLKTLQQSTYLGGSGSDQANALVVADGDDVRAYLLDHLVHVPLSTQHRSVHGLEAVNQLQPHLLRRDGVVLSSPGCGIGSHDHHQLIAELLRFAEVVHMPGVQDIEHSARHHSGHFDHLLASHASIISAPSRYTSPERLAYS